MEREKRDRKGKEAGKAEEKDATWIADEESLSADEQFLAHHHIQGKFRHEIYVPLPWR